MSKYRQSGLYPFFMAMILFGLTACIMKEHVHCSIEDYHPHQKIILPQNKTIVVVGGCFDILHYGHIRFLEEAYKAGGTNAYLVVALEPDSRIIHGKKRQPVHTQCERAQILASIRYIDKVLLLGDLKTDADYNQLVQDIQPHIIAVTSDDPQIENKRLQAKRVGALLKSVIDRIDFFASSKILTTGSQKPKTISYTNVVQEGMHKARILNCPTANIEIHPPFPKEGVYSCTVNVKGTLHPGMCYYDNKRPGILEAHLFDDSRDLYGQEITISLRRFIRSSQKFDSLEALKQCIIQDASLCRQDLEE